MAEPRGARVFLYTDDNRRYLGRAPQSATLDPTKTYRVQFEKSGYEDGEQTIEFTSSATLEVAVTLERKRRDRDDDEIRPGADRDEFGETGEEIDEGVALEKVDNATGEEAFVDDEPEPEYGTLRLQAKPPCRILIDGAPRGRTPQRNLRVRAGSHRITLINSEFGIRESFRVRVGAGEIRTVVKNLTHLIQ